MGLFKKESSKSPPKSEDPPTSGKTNRRLLNHHNSKHPTSYVRVIHIDTKAFDFKDHNDLGTSHNGNHGNEDMPHNEDHSHTEENPSSNGYHHEDV